MPVLPDFDFEPAISEEMGELEPAGEGEEGSDEEMRRRRRRRGRRGGRGRRRVDERSGEPATGEEGAASPDQDSTPAVADASYAERGERSDEPRESAGSRPWLRGWEGEPAAPPREREGYEAPDLEPGEPSALRAAGRPGTDVTPRFGRRSSRLPRPGEAPGTGAPSAGGQVAPPIPPAPAEPPAPAPTPAEPGEDGVLDFISKPSEARAAPGQKVRRHRR